MQAVCFARTAGGGSCGRLHPAAAVTLGLLGSSVEARRGPPAASYACRGLVGRSASISAWAPPCAEDSQIDPALWTCNGGLERFR